MQGMQVLLVEDDPELAEGIAAFLGGQGDTVVLAMDGTEADRLLQTERFDFVLLDVGLPGLGGYEVVRRLRLRRQSLPVILITARDALDDRIYGLDLGADDYLPKPFELSELSARMRAVLRRGGHAAAHRVAFGPLAMDVEGRLAELAGQPIALTAREWDLLQALAEADGRAVPKERLQAEGSGNVVEVYVSRLRPRLETAGLLIRTVRGFGYRLELAGPARPAPAANAD
jgi:DNA-binding response OmpR family regulator